MKVLVATDKPFAKIAINQIRYEVEKVGFELVLLEKYTQQQELLDAVSNVDAMIVRSDIVDEKVLKAARQLKIVVRAGAGYDNIDVKVATEVGVCVMNTPGQNANAVAELVFGLLVYAVRNFYDGSSGTELKDKKIGIHAYGNVGRCVARIANGFGMKVYAYDLFCNPKDIQADGVTPVNSVEELYQNCDIVSVHIPATKDTKQSINARLLSLMPQNAILVNTARKEVMHEADMLAHIATHSDFIYLTDIIPDNHLDMQQYAKQYFSTPKKMGAQTSEANINAGIAAAKQIVDFIKNGNTQYKVN